MITAVSNKFAKNDPNQFTQFYHATVRQMLDLLSTLKEFKQQENKIFYHTDHTHFLCQNIKKMVIILQIM